MTDDRDIEPANPSKSFKVGEFDRLSGFFTPVWESKRKIRSESPIPSSSGAASAPSVRNPASSKASKPGSAPALVTGKGTSGEEASPESPAPVSAARGADEPLDKAAPTLQAARPEPRCDAGEASNGAPSPAPPPAVTVRPVIPMPRTQGRLSARAKQASKPPSAASIALEQAGPNLPPEAYLDRQPELRARGANAEPPRRADQASIHFRSLRAAAAATAVHDKLEARLPLNSTETLAKHRETDSDREAVMAVEARARASSAEGYPLQLLRRLRRTIHISMPLPEAVRSLLDRYRRN